MDGKRKRGARSVSVAAVFALICLAAFATRLLPLSMSQYPFNNDSLIECGLASEISSTGHLSITPGSPWYGTHSVATPVLNILLSFGSQSLGTSSFAIAQVLTAFFFVLTATGIFILARMITGTNMGGLAASIASIILGTFAFTTGSTWKVALGMSLLTLLFISYIRRDQPRFRLLTMTILLILPLVHHLVTAVGYLAMSYFVLWSWFFALTRSSVSTRQYLDAATVAPPILIAAIYYSYTLTDRLTLLSSLTNSFLFLSCFILLVLLLFAVLSLRSHMKWSFGPLVGVTVAILLFLDYSGYLSPYVHTASDSYILLILASSVIIGFAWQGAEAVIERRPVYRAVMLGLLMSPLTVILFGLSMGLTGTTSQILYRTFDFADLFIFVGIGYSVSLSGSRMSRKSLIQFLAILVGLLVSFPFGYYTSSLLGVRHDTAAYEVDAAEWISSHSDSLQIASDERLGRIAHSIAWVEKRSYLPHDLLVNISPLPGMYYMMEDSWTDVGVNDYPYGTAVIPKSLYVSTLEYSDVPYIGGPRNDRLVIFTPSDIPDIPTA